LQALWQSGRSVRRGGTLVGVYTGAIPLAPIGEMFDRQLTVTMGQANVKQMYEKFQKEDAASRSCSDRRR
jgi:threonine dehydrogenase-like Zn-dependent dehydrogenase